MPQWFQGLRDPYRERRMERTRFVQRRKTVGLNQEALAEQLGVDVSSICRWEYGQRLPQPWQRPNLASALKISVEQLAGLLGDPDAPEVEHREVMAALLPRLGATRRFRKSSRPLLIRSSWPPSARSKNSASS